MRKLLACLLALAMCVSLFAAVLPSLLRPLPPQKPRLPLWKPLRLHPLRMF